MSKLKPKHKLRILSAYPYLKKDLVTELKRFDDEYPDTLELLIDSGAFTAWKSGKEIKLNDYCAFLDAFPFEPFRYITLDVIGKPRETEENLDKMIQRGYKPVPVLTPGESKDKIEDYYKISDLIAAGGLTSKYGRDALLYITDLVKKVGDRKIHLLGYTSMPLIKKLRPYSCDSTTWANGAKYGELSIYMGKGNLKRYYKRNFTKRPPLELVRQMEKLGFNIKDTMKEENWRGGNCIQRPIVAASWVKMQQDVYKNIGTRIFLALGSKDDFRLIRDNFLRLEQ